MIHISQLKTSVSYIFFFSSRRLHTIYWRDWSSDVCSSDLSRLVLDKADPDEVRRAADRRYETAHRCTVGDHEHHGGAEAETAGVPLAFGLVGDQTSQSGHHAETDREEHRGGGGVRDEGADRGGDGAEGDDNPVG